eukprot:9490380-Pyramimonas_sp.AAC.1
MLRADSSSEAPSSRSGARSPCRKRRRDDPRSGKTKRNRVGYCPLNKGFVEKFIGVGQGVCMQVARRRAHTCRPPRMPTNTEGFIGAEKRGLSASREAAHTHLLAAEDALVEEGAEERAHG